MTTLSNSHTIPTQQDLYHPVLLALQNLDGGGSKDIKAETTLIVDPHNRYKDAVLKNGSSKLHNTIGFALYYCEIAELVKRSEISQEDNTNFYSLTPAGHDATEMTSEQVIAVVRPYAQAYAKSRQEARSENPEQHKSIQDNELHTRIINLYKLAPKLTQRQIGEAVGCSQSKVSFVVRAYTNRDTTESQKHTHYKVPLKQRLLATQPKTTHDPLTTDHTARIIVEHIDEHLEELYRQVESIKAVS